MKKKIPCGGFYYDDNSLVFTKDIQGNYILKSRPIFEKISDWLYYCDYDYYDYDNIEEYLKHYKSCANCSEIRVLNLIGRNFDWYYGNEVQMIIRTKAVNGRHATLGVCNTPLTKEQIDSNIWQTNINAIPFLVNDCINDKGVYVGINVVPTGDKGRTIGTNPNAEISIPQIGLVRFLADYSDSAKDAIDILQNINVYSFQSDAQSGECHFLICDKDDSYIVEFINNELSVLSSTDSDFDPIPNDKVIMTNFYETDWDGDIKAVFMGDSESAVKATGLTKHSNGLERYDILSDGVSDVSDMDDMSDLMQEVKYTLSYNENQNPFWYSEFLDGSYTIYSTAEELAEIKEGAIEAFEHRQRDKQTWYTAHTSIYDIENKKLRIYVNEDYENKYEFQLHILGKL